jgi:hypothetical protein
MMSEHGQDFDGMRNFLEKYLFISDDIIELQMFQGCQNWSWISQGVLGSNLSHYLETKMDGQSSCMCVCISSADSVHVHGSGRS